MKGNTIYEVTIKGLRPMLHHNGRLADPLDDHAKALRAAAKKRDKGDDDYEEVGRLEFEGGLYFDGKLGPFVPYDNLQAVIERGATKRKLGKLFKACVGLDIDVEAPGVPLKYAGPRDPAGLWKDRRFVLRKVARVNQSRVMRTRARFPAGWLATFRVEVLEDAVTKQQLEQAIADGGIYEGVGDWRPRYGRFEVESIKEI